MLINQLHIRIFKIDLVNIFDINLTHLKNLEFWILNFSLTYKIIFKNQNFVINSLWATQYSYERCIDVFRHSYSIYLFDIIELFQMNQWLSDWYEINISDNIFSDD